MTPAGLSQPADALAIAAKNVAAIAAMRDVAHPCARETLGVRDHRLMPDRNEDGHWIYRCERCDYEEVT